VTTYYRVVATGQEIARRLRGSSPIRRAGLDDAEALRALKDAVVDATWGDVYDRAALDAWKARFVSHAYFAERLVDSPDTPLTRFYIAGPRSAPLGMIALKVREGRAYVGDLYVRAPRRGIGRRLLWRAEDEAVALGFDAVVADVFDGNRPAYALLASEGFREEGEYLDSSLRTRVLRLSRPLAPFLRPLS
jgi:ribosomal protein S18 acetylase RimI-like enzyme